MVDDDDGGLASSYLERETPVTKANERKCGGRSPPSWAGGVREGPRSCGKAVAECRGLQAAMVTWHDLVFRGLG